MQAPKSFRRIDQGSSKEVYKQIVRNFEAGKLNTEQLLALQDWLNEMHKLYPPRDSEGNLIKEEK